MYSVFLNKWNGVKNTIFSYKCGMKAKSGRKCTSKLSKCVKYVPSNKKTNFMCKNCLSFPGYCTICVLCQRTGRADSHVALQGGADWLISRRCKHYSYSVHLKSVWFEKVALLLRFKRQNILNCNSLQWIGTCSRARSDLARGCWIKGNSAHLKCPTVPAAMKGTVSIQHRNG